MDTDTTTARIKNEDGEEDEDGSVGPENVMIEPQLPPEARVVYSEAPIDKL